MRDYRRLDVFHEAHQLTLDVYRHTQAFPSAERYGLVAQIRRAAVSIGSNIAEGAGRPTDPDFARFIGLAMGSSNELEYQITLARDLGWLEREAATDLHRSVQHVRSMLTRLHQRLARSLDTSPGVR